MRFKLAFRPNPAKGRHFSSSAGDAGKPEGPRNGADQPAIGSIDERLGMPLYEHTFLARQDLSQAQVDALAATATEIIEANQGKVTKTETWGLKNLAYKIKRNRKAHFVMLNIEAPAGTVAELERQTAINEDVIRWLTVRVDEFKNDATTAVANRMIAQR